MQVAHCGEVVDGVRLPTAVAFMVRAPYRFTFSIFCCSHAPYIPKSKSDDRRHFRVDTSCLVIYLARSTALDHVYVLIHPSTCCCFRRYASTIDARASQEANKASLVRNSFVVRSTLVLNKNDNDLALTTDGYSRIRARSNSSFVGNVPHGPPGSQQYRLGQLEVRLCTERRAARMVQEGLTL